MCGKFQKMFLSEIELRNFPTLAEVPYTPPHGFFCQDEMIIKVRCT